MCTRYYVELSPELRPYIEAAGRSHLARQMISRLGKPFHSEGEIRPTDMAAVIAPSSSGTRAAFPMVWGYHVPGVPHTVVNARSESAGAKKTFAKDWQRHRCIVPASWYFEWEHLVQSDGKVKTGEKYSIQPRNASVTYLAGLYRMETTREFRYPVFTVLTREPGENLKQLHDRMPVILPEDAIDDWIRPGGHPEKILEASLTDMVYEKAVPEAQMGMPPACPAPIRVTSSCASAACSRFR